MHLICPQDEEAIAQLTKKMDKLKVGEAKKEAKKEEKKIEKEETKEKVASTGGVKFPRKGRLINRNKAKKETRKETTKEKGVEETKEKTKKPVAGNEEDEWEDEGEDYPAVKLSELLSELTINDQNAQFTSPVPTPVTNPSTKEDKH